MALSGAKHPAVCWDWIWITLNTILEQWIHTCHMLLFRARTCFFVSRWNDWAWVVGGHACIISINQLKPGITLNYLNLFCFWHFLAHFRKIKWFRKTWWFLKGLWFLQNLWLLQVRDSDILTCQRLSDTALNYVLMSLRCNLKASIALRSLLLGYIWSRACSKSIPGQIAQRLSSRILTMA